MKKQGSFVEVCADSWQSLPRPDISLRYAPSTITDLFERQLESQIIQLQADRVSTTQLTFSMNIQEQINEYIASQPEPKRSDLEALQRLIGNVLPDGKLWFDEGKNSENKPINNPTIGYGLYTIHYANGKTKEFFQIGTSVNKTGISVYILGIDDKTYLPQMFGKKLGRASVTGYCIKFKTLKDIHIDTLEEAIRYGVEASRQA